MNFEKFLSFVQSNIDFFSTDDVKLIVEGKYYKLFDTLTKKSVQEKDKKNKIKIEKILSFLGDFIQDYRSFSYKYDYYKSTTFENYEYWFDFYLKNKFLNKAEKVVHDMKKKFPDEKRVEKYKKIISKEKVSYEKEFSAIKYKHDREHKLKYIETLISQSSYGQAMAEVLKFIQSYPNDKVVEKYIKKIDAVKSQNLVENIAINKNYFEKIGLLRLTKMEELKSNDLKDIYKKLSILVRKEDFESGLSLIKYIKDKFKIDDIKLLKYYNQFTEISSKLQQKKQKEEYDLEYKSLKLLFKNKQFEEALAKANLMLKKYPLISKKDILGFLKRIKDKRAEFLKQKNKTKIDQSIENFMYKISPLTKKGLFQFYQKMAWFLNAKMDLKLSLQIVYFQAKDLGLKKFIKDILEGIDSGMKLSEIMKWYSAVGRLDIALIKIGESTGKLGDMFNTIHSNYKESDERRKKIISVLIYPVIIIAVTIIIFILLLIFIVPKFITLFDQVDITLPYITQVIVNMSSFVKTKWYLLIIFFITFVAFLIGLGKTRAGKLIFGYMSLRIPILKELLFKKYVIYFSENLSLLLRSGINLLEAIDLVVYGTDNLFYQDEFKRIRFELETGVTFSKSVGLGNITDVGNYTNPYIPIDLAYAVDVGERTGQLGDLLGEVSKRYDDDLKLMIKNLQSMMEPFVILLVGGVIFIFVLSIFLPLMQMYNAIGKLGNM